MSSLSRILQKIDKVKGEYSIDALTHPSQKDLFEYGKHCGVIEGLCRAEQFVVDEVEGEKRDQFE